jgi:NhaA family Na+:H+ antiporter
VKRVLGPVERFLAIETSGGILLMIAAVLALGWANSPWREFYAQLWRIPIGLRFGGLEFERDLLFWINDGLMTLFFFVVGLEIRREIHAGELSEIRRAMLPVAAAAGGMIVPALIFALLNYGRSSAPGWAIPMATDIAFAVGIFALLGKRVAPALRILLLALAVIDDVGAILVIAAFYSTEGAWSGFAVLALGVFSTFVLQMVAIRSPFAYLGPGILVWAGAYSAGIHPTLAGVIMGMLTPAKAWHGPDGFVAQTEAKLRSLRSGDVSDGSKLLSHLGDMTAVNREAVSPVERLQHMLHGWVAFAVMPVFAFANAGVSVGRISLDGDSLWLFMGITLGLALGKPVGILLASWLAVRSGGASLPRGVRWPAVTAVGMVGGIGFTMALFVAQLAFPGGAYLEVSTLAILCGSGLAALLSLLVGHRILRPAASSSRTET